MALDHEADVADQRLVEQRVQDIPSCEAISGKRVSLVRSIGGAYGSSCAPRQVS